MVFSTLSSIMNAILSVASANYFGSALAQWQLLFLLVGVVTVAVAALLWIFLPDNPTTCWWLSDREKVIAIKRLAGNRTGVRALQSPTALLTCGVAGREQGVEMVSGPGSRAGPQVIPLLPDQRASQPALADMPIL